MNPVLQRELTERWRSRRAPVTLTLYLSVLGGVLFLLYVLARAMLGSSFRGGGGMGPGMGMDAAAVGPLLGRFLLEGLLFTILLLVLFVAPAYAAAQITSERERRTLALLQVTLLRPWQIVAGKLGAATSWLLLLVVAAVPLGAGAFFLGGAGLPDLLRGLVFIVAIAVGIAGMALGISSVARRTTGAVVLTYGLVLALVGGTAIAGAAEALIEARDGEFDRSSPPLALYANPVYGLADAVRAGAMRRFDGPFVPSPLALMAQALPQTSRPPQAGFAEARAMPAGPDVFVEERVVLGDPGIGPGFDEEAPRQAVWLKVMGVYGLLGFLGLAVATRRLRTAEPQPPMSRRARRRHRRSAGERHAAPGAQALDPVAPAVSAAGDVDPP